MTHAEARMWSAYMSKRGSLNVGLRVEMGTALLAWQLHHALGGKSKMDVFMPNVVRRSDEPQEDMKEATLDDVLTLMGVKR